MFGDVVLITPAFGKHIWSKNELHLRSLLLRSDGKILDSGFPKFFNYSEVPELDSITLRCILNGQAHYAHKMDGSLIVRTVHNGLVNFRTRGSDNLGDFHEPVMSVITEKYPNLLSPEVCSETTLLFEYTTPAEERKVIVSYSEDDLTILGGMRISYDYNLPRIVGGPNFLEWASHKTGVPSVEFHNLGLSPDEVVRSVTEWTDSEGVVVWCEVGSEWHLSKIKSDWYRNLHSLKYHLTEDKIQKLALVRGIYTLDQLREVLFSLGLDWEAYKVARPKFETYLERKISVENEYNEFIRMLEEKGLHLLTSRKRKAMELKELTSDKKLFGIGMMFLTGQHERIQRYTLAHSLGISVNYLDQYLADAETLSSEFNLNRTAEE